MPYLGRAPTVANNVTGDLAVSGAILADGQISGGSINHKLALDGSDVGGSNEYDQFIFEDGGTDGSGTNAGDNLLLENATGGQAISGDIIGGGIPISSIAGAGTSGQFLQSQGTGIAPTFATVATGGGSWDHIITSNPSGDSSLSYTCGDGSSNTMDTGSHDIFKIEIVMSINSTTSEIIQIQPNGAGAIRVVGDYTRGSNDLGALTSYSTLTTTGAASSGVYREVTATDPSVAICPAGSNRISGQVFYNPLGNPAFLTGRMIMRDSNGSNWRMGIFDWAASMNAEPTALVFFYGSNFGSGTEFSVYGLRQS